ncbi:MAG: sigma-70 family RNA polymerase sigma factor [Bacteroidales bacterium]|nr:sigma-70 family RNA polymerase sigma factor [Bacteroidales bacterium]
MSTHPKYEKSQLVSLCLQGDREAQSQLYTSYHRKMLKIIRQYVSDPDLAQDVLHDGFIIILSQLKSLRDPERLDYWMATIMKNLAIHSLSQLQFDSILEEDVEEEPAEEEQISFEELVKYIDLLPDGCRAVFRLAVLEGKSHKEISAMLGITPKSSASQLARAKERLRQLIR